MWFVHSLHALQQIQAKAITYNVNILPYRCLYMDSVVLCIDEDVRGLSERNAISSANIILLVVQCNTQRKSNKIGIINLTAQTQCYDC